VVSFAVITLGVSQCVCYLFRYRLCPETCGYTLVYMTQGRKLAASWEHGNEPSGFISS